VENQRKIKQNLLTKAHAMLCFTHWGISEFVFRWILGGCAGGGRRGE